MRIPPIWFALLLSFIGVVKAAPVTGPWLQSTGSAVLSNVNTASPTWGNGTLDNADASSIYAAFPAVSLLATGDKVTLTGSAQFEGITAAAEVIRWGVFSVNGSPDTNGWLGYFLRNGNATSGASLMERTSPNTTQFPSVTGAVSLGSTSGPGSALTNATYDFVISYERTAANGLQVNTSFKRATDNVDFANLSLLDTTPQTFVFDRVGFLATTNLNADRIQLTNVTITVTTGTVTPPTSNALEITQFGLGPITEPVGGGPTLRWNAQTGREYAVEGSPDLQTWTRVGPPIRAASVDGTTRIGPMASMPSFLRVRDRVVTPPAPVTRPNILFIAVDDLRPEIAALGATWMHTPNLDRLVQTGRAFQRHYVQCPTCGASRYALMTSRRPTTSTAAGNEAFVSLYPGAGTPASPNSFPEAFKQAGYTTVALGKLSHYPGGYTDTGALEMPGSWTEVTGPSGIWGSAENAFFAYAGGITRTVGVSLRTEIGVASDGVTSLADTDYPDGIMAQNAIQRLRNFKTSGEPFFLAVGFYKPHLPFNAPKNYWDLYDRNAITVPTTQTPTGVNPALTLSNNGEFLGNYGGPNTIDEAEAKLSIHGYRACVSYTDAQIGKVLDELQALGLDQNTIVVLWGDHGWALGELGIWGKHTTLEESLRSPLIIRTPGLAQPGVVTQTLVETIDIYPTLADLCNVPIPPLEGRSFAPALLNPALPAKGYALSYWRNSSTDGYSLRTDRYRLVRWGNIPTAPVQVDLFDYQLDPAGSQSGTSTQPAIVTEMLKLLP